MMAYGLGMPISDAELATLLTYIRSSWGNSASAISTEDVARVKVATADRTTAWTAPELTAAMP
jgi:mono/diheme cytochrome c family protein